MADSRYVIDLVLNARDQTSAAVNKAMANLGLLEAREKAAADAAEKFGQRYERAMNKVDESSTSLAATREQLHKVGDEFGVTAKKSLEAIDRLDQATRNHQRAIDQYGESHTKTQLALHQVLDAQKQLTEFEGTALATKVRLNAAEQEHGRIVAEVAETVAQAEEKSIARRIAANKELETILAEAERDHRERNDRDAQDFLDAERRKVEARRASQAELTRILDEADEDSRARRERDAQEFLAGEKAKEQAAAQRVRAASTREREYQALLRETLRARQQADTGRTRGATPQVQTELDARTETFQLKLDRAAEEIRRLDGRKVDVQLDLDTAKFLAESRVAQRELKDLGDEANQTRSFFGILRNSLNGVGGSFDNSTSRIAAFDNLLRGLMTLGITVFLQQLIQVGGAAAGMLAALAASAVQAGAALGGALVAGLGQAMPVLGIFATALTRVKGVIDAVKQANLLEQQQSYQSTGQQDKQAKSLENVRRATEALTKARRDAVRQIQDLILAERAAELAAEGAALSQEDAQKALQAAIASGGDVERAQLQVKEADLGVDQADQNLVKARRARREGADPENTEGVRNAKRALRDAQTAAQQTEDSVTAAKGKLDYLLANMSTAEVALYKALVRLQKRFQDVAKDISEPIIVQFTAMANRVTQILGDAKMIKVAKDLSGGIANAMGGVFDSFTDERTLAQFRGFARDAQKNLKPLESIIENVGHAFINIGRLASPVLADLAKWLAGLSKDFRGITTSASGRNALRTYFTEGLDALKDWANLLYQIVRLFLAISGAGGAAEGTKAVKDMGDAVGRAADTIADKGSKANKWFRDFFKTSREVVDAILPIFKSLAREFVLTFGDNTVSSVQGFAAILADVVIPAIGQFIRKIGEGTTAVGQFLKQHPGASGLIKDILGILLVATTLSKLSVFFAPVFSVFKILGNVISGVTKNSGGFVKVLESVWGVIGRVIARSDTLVKIILNLADRFAFLRGLALGPWGLIAAVILAVIVKLGLFKDLLHAVGGFFTALWGQVKDPLSHLWEAVQNLWKALSDGEGAFKIFDVLLAVLKPILKIAIEIVGFFLEGFGRSIGKVIGGVIDVLAGLINIVVGLLTGDWKMAWKGAKEVVGGAVKAIIGVLELVLFRGVGRIFGKIGGAAIGGLKGLGRAILGAFKDAARLVIDDLPAAFRAVIGFFKGLPRTLLDFFKSLPGNLKNAFVSAGKAIVNGLKEGIESLKDALPKALRNIIEKMPGGKIILKGIDAVGGVASSVYDNTVGRLFKNSGGPVPGQGSGDTVPAMLTPGEHVLTKREVQAAGGHAVIFALRRLLGGGGQGGPIGYAPGGTVYSGNNQLGVRTNVYSPTNDVGLPTAAQVAEAKRLTAQRAADAKAAREAEAEARRKDLTTTREDYKKSSDERAEDNRVMWNDILTTTRRATNDVAAQVREMRVAMGKTLARLNEDTSGQVEDFVGYWANAFSAISDVVYEGLTYIGHETNKVLHALGGSTLNFGLSKPSQETGDLGSSTDRAKGGRYATGGFVGMPGERGRDAVHALVGRGEAFLNWGQQKLINANLRGQETLGSILHRSRGWHAGGQESPGFATGGGDIFDGHPSNVNSAVKALIELMKKHFPLVVTSTTDHSRLTTSGNVSDHTAGAAVDLSGSVSVMNRAAAWVKSSGLYKKLKQAIHNPNLAVNAGQLQDPPGQFAGAVWAQHANHLHLAITGALRGAFEAAASAVRKRSVTGPSGGLRTLAQTVLDRALKAAGVKLSDAGGDSDADTDESIPVGQGPKGREIFRYFKRAGFTDEQAAAWVGNFVQESGLNPAVVQPNGEGHGLAQWGGGRFAALQAFAAQRHTKWQDLQTQLDFVMHELRGSENAAMSAIKSARSLDEAVNAIGLRYERYGIRGDRSGPAREALKAYGGAFADGGIVPGGSGRPVHIVAHAGEWVLNTLQQSKLARALGTGIGQVRNYLGFTGGPTSFAGGGEVKTFGFDRTGQVEVGEITPLEIPAMENRIKRIADSIRKLRNPFKNIDALLHNADALTNDQSGLFTTFNTAIELQATRAANTLTLLQAGFKRIGHKLRSVTPLADPTRIALAELNALDEAGAEFIKGRAAAVSGLYRVNQEIRKLRKGGISSKELEQFQQLVGQRVDFQSAIDDYDAKIAQNAADRIAKAQELFDARTDARLRDNTRAQGRTDQMSRIGSALGITQRTRVTVGNRQITIGSPQDIANRELTEATRNQKIIGERYDAAARRARRDPRWQEKADQLLEQLHDATGDVADKTHAALQAGIDSITQRYENAQSGLDLSRRFAEAIGNKAALPDITRQTIQLYRNNIAELETAATDAFNRGDAGAYASIRKSIGDLQAKVTEGGLQLINEISGAADDAFSKQSARLDVLGRLADLRERGGDKLGAITDRQTVSRSRGAALAADLAGNQAALAEAQRLGNTGAIESLTDKIADLNAQIAENSAATNDLTYQYRQAAVDIITGRTTRSTGLIGSAQSLLEKIATNAGTTYDARDLLEKQGEEFRKAIPEIASQVGEASTRQEFAGRAGGVLDSLRAAFLTGPTDFANKLAELGPEIAALETTMGDAQKSTFQTLIDAMLNNTTSVVDNTKAVQDVTGALSGPQSFASSSWSWFRNAIFSGMGDVLPRYAIPGMASGGSVTKGGIFELHPGEFVVNPDGSNVPDSGDINITMNSVNGDVDLTALAARIAFAKKSRR